MNINIKRVKISVTIPVDNVKKVIQSLRKAYPYEEPAIDIISLIEESEFK